MHPLRHYHVLGKAIPNFLLASPNPTLLRDLELLLSAEGGHVELTMSAESMLASLAESGHLSLVVLDADLPGMEMDRLLAAVRETAHSPRFSIVLIADAVTPELVDRLDEGVIDDIVPHATELSFWRVRIGDALRRQCAQSELDILRESVSMSAQYDRLTGAYNRETILSMLFRETDRAQRTNSPLSLVLFDIDDFGHWNSRLGAQVCDELLVQVAGRTAHLLRSYDLLGRAGKDEFLLGLPGCNSVNAVMVAERARVDVFCSPFHVAGEAVRLSACFGISSSNGRTPLVVLREAEKALASARATGPESIQCFGACPEPQPEPVTFFSPASGDELLAW